MENNAVVAIDAQLGVLRSILHHHRTRQGGGGAGDRFERFTQRVLARVEEAGRDVDAYWGEQDRHTARQLRRALAAARTTGNRADCRRIVRQALANLQHRSLMVHHEQLRVFRFDDSYLQLQFTGLRGQSYRVHRETGAVVSLKNNISLGNVVCEPAEWLLTHL
jgi:hypothetical protein